MSQYLRESIESLIPDQEVPLDPDPHAWLFAERRPIGNPEPLLWTGWRRRFSGQEIQALRNELEADLGATTGDWVGRARQVAWYLDADLLVGDETWEGDDSEQKAGDRGVRLLRELTGVPIELAVSRGTSASHLLKVHTPGSVVGFWLDDYTWTFGWPEPGSPDIWRISGQLAPALELTIGELANHIIEGIATGAWPFGGAAPDEGSPGVRS
jgi:hypothetical protein